MTLLKMLFYKAQDLKRSDCGATVIEYALMATAIAIAIVVVVFALGDGVVLLIEDLPAALSAS